MKARTDETSRGRVEVLKYHAANMVDRSIVKAIDDKGFLKKLK